MPVYFSARIRIHNAAEYQKYLDSCGAVFARYDGRYLAVDDAPEALEGSPAEGRRVLIEFPCRDAFFRWYRSAEYQSLLRHRLDGAECEAILIQGYDK